MNRSKRAVLVVEDSFVQRAHVVDLLGDLGFDHILEADNGIHALRVLDTHAAEPIPLVITDLDMPEMDGIELIRHLAESGPARELVVMSARDPRLFEIVERMAGERGVLRLLGTLPKPVELEDLQAVLERGAAADSVVVRKPPPLIALDEVERALRDDEFVPYFQPKVSVGSGALRGVEALARWLHPARGLLTADSFIPAIEGTDLMRPFTLKIAEEALRRLTWLHDRGMASLSVSINLSADSLADRRFISQLAALIDLFGLPANLVVWEVTETMFMGDASESLANLARLGLKGFGLAMDDYGVGYSSIQQFSRCPFTELKIDRAFVNGAAGRPNRRAILEGAIELGRRLGVTTVAEGVESAEDLEVLRDIGCDMAQGYFIGKPMPVLDLPAWFREGRYGRRGAVPARGEASPLHLVARDAKPIR